MEQRLKSRCRRLCAAAEFEPAAGEANPLLAELLAESPELANAPDPDFGLTALRCAVRAGRVENVRRLIELGAEPEDGMLVEAAGLRECGAARRVMELLLGAGTPARFEVWVSLAQRLPANLSEQCSDWEELAVWLVQDGFPLCRGAELDENRRGEYTLRYRGAGRPGRGKYQIEGTERGDRTITALHLVASRGSLPVLREMQLHGADPAAKDAYGRTAYDWASQAVQQQGFDRVPWSRLTHRTFPSATREGAVAAVMVAGGSSSSFWRLVAQNEVVLDLLVEQLADYDDRDVDI